jgi:hypothetical protein
MTKKKISSLAGLLLIMILAACASLQSPGASTAAGDGTQAALQNPAGQSIEGRLAMGTLGLEDSAHAVSAEQARALLPLWKAVKSLSSSQTASSEEINALYAQIAESMTAEQLQFIEDMALGQEEMAALMEKFDIQFQAPQGGGNAISEDARATRIAQFQAEGGTAGGRGAGGGGFPGGGMPEGGFPADGSMPPGMGAGGTGGAGDGVQRTLVPGQTGRAGRGMNNLFVDPLIALLQERAGG